LSTGNGTSAATIAEAEAEAEADDALELAHELCRE
jgi:hypothetical protein